jgi:predicted nucleic acid-binding protein
MNGAQGFLLDTSVVLHATRENSPVSKAIDSQFGLSTSRFRPAICEVTIGELLAFALSYKWGEKRKSLLTQQIDKALVIPISHPGVHQRWAEMSSALQSVGRTIGQNDIWIAATASVAGMTLLTTDKDFLTVGRVAALDVRVLDGKTGLAQP